MENTTTASAPLKRRWTLGDQLQDSRSRKYLIVMKKEDRTCHLDEEFRLQPQDGKSSFLPKWMSKRELQDHDFINITSPLTIAATDLRQASQRLYDAIQDFLDVPDNELPIELVEAMDAMEAAWHKADGTQPEA